MDKRLYSDIWSHLLTFLPLTDFVRLGQTSTRAQMQTLKGCPAICFNPSQAHKSCRLVGALASPYGSRIKSLGSNFDSSFINFKQDTSLVHYPIRFEDVVLNYVAQSPIYQIDTKIMDSIPEVW